MQIYVHISLKTTDIVYISPTCKQEVLQKAARGA